MSDNAQAELLFGVRFFHEMSNRDPKHPRNPFPLEIQTKSGKTVRVDYTESGCHVTGDHWAVFIYIVESTHECSNWGDSKPIDPSQMTVPAEWYEALQEACKVAGVEYEEPHWWISAYYG